MTLTHELFDSDAGSNDFDRRLDKLVADGFEMLKDLTGPQPDAFAGLYLSWYGEAVALIQQVVPSRLAEFTRLYRLERRKRLDYESYVIEDYLLGVSLHGGFGALDAMRAIAARRFHLQILLLKSLLPEARRGFEHLKRSLARETAETLLDLAEATNRNGSQQGSVALAASAILVQLKARATAQRSNPQGKTELAKWARRLEANGAISKPPLSLCERLDSALNSSVLLEAEVTEMLSDCRAQLAVLA